MSGQCRIEFYFKAADLEKLLKETTLIAQAIVASTDASKELINKKNSIVNILLCTAEAGCGKTLLDGHFAYARALLLKNVANGRGERDVLDAMTAAFCFYY
jgi:hypothetical protein